MKKSDLLKQQRAEKFARMEEINAGAETAKRELNPEETTEFDNLDKEIDNLDKEIERAVKFEARQIEAAGKKTPQKTEIEREKENYSIAKAIREFTNGGAGGLTGREKEIQTEFSKRIQSSGLLLPYSRANENTTTTHATIVETGIHPSLSIIGKEPLHQKMGVTMMPGLTGTLKLPYKSPTTGQKVAVGTALANNSDNPSHVTLSPERFGDTDDWYMDLLKTQNDAVYQSLLADMLKGIERKITAEVYTVALDGATEVTNAAITQAGINLLMAAVDADNCAFAMDPASFYTGKAVKIDSGSGIMLFKALQNNIGETFEGVKAFYSSLFADGANKQYVLYGDWSKVVVGEWDGLEMIIDPYTNAKKAMVSITLNKIADVVLRDGNAMVVSPDLDATT